MVRARVSLPAQSWHDREAPLCSECGHVHDYRGGDCYMACGCPRFVCGDNDYQTYWDGLTKTERAEEMRMLDNHEGSGT